MNEVLDLGAKAPGIWSRAGENISSARNGSEIATLCGMDGSWLSKCQVYFRNSRQELHPIPGCYAVVERDIIPHGIVKGRYNPVEASRIFRIFDKMIGREVEPYRAGTARTGNLQSYIWMLMKNTIVLEWPIPDSTPMFLVLSAHSGDKAIKITPVIAFEGKQPTLAPCFKKPITIKHSAAADASLTDVERNMALALTAHTEAVEVWRVTSGRAIEGDPYALTLGLKDLDAKNHWDAYVEACFRLDIRAMSRGRLSSSEASSKFLGRMMTSLMARKMEAGKLLVEAALADT